MVFTVLSHDSEKRLEARATPKAKALYVEWKNFIRRGSTKMKQGYFKRIWKLMASIRELVDMNVFRAVLEFDMS